MGYAQLSDNGLSERLERFPGSFRFTCFWTIAGSLVGRTSTSLSCLGECARSSWHAYDLRFTRPGHRGLHHLSGLHRDPGKPDSQQPVSRIEVNSNHYCRFNWSILHQAVKLESLCTQWFWRGNERSSGGLFCLHRI